MNCSHPAPPINPLPRRKTKSKDLLQMEQFRQAGEALGSIRGLMSFHDEIRINQRQCLLLFDAFSLALDGIADEIKLHLKFEERLTNWNPLENPLRELCRIFREGEQYIRQCLEPKDWRARSLSLCFNTDCVELHLHNLLWCIPVVLEAIECVGEVSGSCHDEVMKRRLLISKKYEREWMDPKLFQCKFGRLYLISLDICSRLDSVWKEDRWILSELMVEKSKALSLQEVRLLELLTSPKGKLFPCSVLLGSKDYQVQRRLGPGSKYKEIQWMGESFAAKHVIGDVGPVKQEISLLSSLSHPNVLHCLYAFCDEDKKECYLLMELMSKDLSGYIKETCCPRRRVPFALPVAVDIMLQIARGMEYLHSRKIYHGNLNPANILVKSRSSSPDGYLHAKVAGLGLPPEKNLKDTVSQAANGNGKASTNQLAKVNGKASTNQSAGTSACIWYAPEVLSEQEQIDDSGHFKYTEKADVYSFAMICFELLTGKVPFEDGHLQGDKMSKNIRAGERPLFPSSCCSKYLNSLTRRCWHTDPSQRPSFLSICRVLRYLKRFLVMKPDHSQPDQPGPLVDYFDLDTWLSKNFTNWARNEATHVSEIPFQMYAYRVIERERTSVNLKEKTSESGSEGPSAFRDDGLLGISICDDSLSLSSKNSSSGANSDCNRKGSAKVDGKANKKTGQNQKARTARPAEQTSGRCSRG